MKNRSYCFTSFNPIKPPTDANIRYLIVGEEICPSTRKTHWQGYIELRKPQRISWIKKVFEDPSVHLEARRGTREQARDYCMKDGKYAEYGNFAAGGQGTRNDLKSIANELVSGTKTIQDVMIEEPALYCKYRNGLKDIAQLGQQRKNQEFRQLYVEFITGPTGCGKTRGASEKFPNAFLLHASELSKNGGSGWWDGYSGEETIIIDDYDNDTNITKMLNILDGYKLRLPLKGSFTYAAWKKVFITSNLRLHEVHPNAKPAHKDAFWRRIHKTTDLW